MKKYKITLTNKLTNHVEQSFIAYSHQAPVLRRKYQSKHPESIVTLEQI